jgi:Membrane bound beta barrel domain (DUF5777)
MLVAVIIKLAERIPLLLVLGISVQQGFARPEYLARYRAYPFARPDLRTCGICHENPKGGGPRNEFGQAVARADHQFTPELRAEFPDRFLQDRAILGEGVEVVFEEAAKGTILVKRGDVTYRVDPAAKDITKVDTGPAEKAATTTTTEAGSGDGGGGSPVFDYHLGNLRTGKVADKGEFHFRFSHRFTSDIFDQSNREFDLFGLDSLALPGIGVGYGFTNRFAMNVYRQTFDRKLEFSGDLSILDENESRSPISVMGRAAIEGRNDFAGQGHNGHYIPSIEFVLSRNLFNRVSLNVNPTFVFNLRRRPLPALEKRMVAIGLGGSVKIRENMAIVGEFIPRVTGNPLDSDIIHDKPTVSFGYQFRTFRHVFELVISNSFETTIAGSALGGADEFHIGFNIHRRIK